MKNKVFMSLISLCLMVVMIPCFFAIAESNGSGDLHTAFGFPFGMSMDEIEETLNGYEGLSVSSMYHTADDVYYPLIKARVSSQTEFKAFNRQIDNILITGDRDRSLSSIVVELKGSENHKTYILQDDSCAEAYQDAIECWPGMISDIIAAYGQTDDIAVFCGEDLVEAHIIDVETATNSEKLASVMPLEWYKEYHHCGIAMHIDNILVELTLTDTIEELLSSKSHNMHDNIVITYSDKPYGRLVEVTPTPAPTPKNSLSNLNILG